MFPSSSSSSSLSSSKVCLNRECSHSRLDRYRPGWRLRTGDFANLCDRCASAYEQGKFCDMFHLRAHGWRCCESCGKRIHCGCIVSESAYKMLDAGGIECLACTRKKFPLGSNFAPPQLYFLQSPIAEKFRDLSVNWSSSTRSNQISCQPPNFLGPSVLQFHLRNRGDRYGFTQPTSNDMGMNDLMGNLTSENSKNHTIDILNNQKAGLNRRVPLCPNVNAYHPPMSLKEGPCGTQSAFPAPNINPNVTNDHSRLDGSNLQHTPTFSPLRRLPSDLSGGAGLIFENKSWNLGNHLDTPGKYQVVPRYWPKDLNKGPDQQNLSKEPNFVVTPLFEKMLSASDAGKLGRMVLPKKSAEAFFPRISNPGGVPLKVQDSMGIEWTFQFRFFPNGMGRKYVLDGVAACIQNMQLQAGDTVIFNRLDPEGKLIMDFRKAPVAQSSDQETDSANNSSDTCTNGEDEPVDTHSPSHAKKSAYRARVELSSKKKKSRTMITRSKRRKVEKGDLDELKLTCEEAQEFLLPPPNFTPSIVVIEGSEFEEYEDAPIIGKPTVCATESRGATYSADEAEQHDDEEALEPTATTRHPRHKTGCPCIVCIQFPSGFSPKHVQGCFCKLCLTMKRRKRSQLLYGEKKRTERAKNAQKKLKSLNFDDEERKNNHEQNTPPLKELIDLNFQPEKDEESSPGPNTKP